MSSTFESLPVDVAQAANAPKDGVHNGYGESNVKEELQ